MREIEWAPPKERPPGFSLAQVAQAEYGPWQPAGDAGRGRGRMTGEAFSLQEDGTWRCPAGASLWLSELRQENTFTQRAVYVAPLENCQGCQLREQCLGRGARGNRARRVSAIRRLLPAPCSVEPQSGVLTATRWVDVAGRALRRSWMSHWRGQHVEVIALAPIPIGVSLRLAPPARSVLIVAGVGMIGSHAMPGGDRHNCALALQAFPLFWPGTNEGGAGKQRSWFNKVSHPSE